MNIICDILLMISTDHNFVLWFVKTKSKFAVMHLNVKGIAVNEHVNVLFVFTN